MTVTGHMNARMLPFHLCDLAGFFYLFLQMQALRTGRWTSLVEIALCLFMPGAVLGILFPVWNVYPPFHYMTIHGFVYHALIILYPWLLFVSGNIRPKTRHIWRPVLLLCGIVPPVYLFNKKFDSNYMFINVPPENTPLNFLQNQMKSVICLDMLFYFSTDTDFISGFRQTYTAVKKVVLLILVSLQTILPYNAARTC